MHRRYSGLDLVRFLAAASVAVFHLGYWAWRDTPTLLLPVVAPIAAFGWVGVEVFFVISGFVIAYSATGKTVGCFIRKRALRLYPAVWVCATIVAVLCPVTIKTFIRSIILFPLGPWVSIVYWTLPLEMAFYGTVAIALWRGLRLELLALCLGYFSTAYWILSFSNGLANGPKPTFFDSEIGYLFLPQFGIFFALGMLLYARRHAPSAFVFTIVGMAEIWRRSHQIQSEALWTAPLAFAIALGLILLSVFRSQAVDSATARVPTRALGLASYPLYLLHAEIGERIVGLSANAYVGFVIAMITVSLLAFLVLPVEWMIRTRFGRLLGGEALQANERGIASVLDSPGGGH